MEVFSSTNPYQQRNIEVKARTTDLEAVRQRAEAVATKGPSILEQRDTFFHSPNGRLKLRELDENKGELIYYERADANEPTESGYLIYPTDSPDRLRALLSDALGIRGEIRKHRTVYATNHARIHLDEIDKLGSFVEIEVMLSMDEETEEGEKISRQLMQQLEIASEDLIDKAYIDLLQESGEM